MILYKIYSSNLKNLEIGEGFFKDWPNPPSQENHRKILEKSYKSLVAIDEKSNKIIGFINAVSDGILSAYIPLLEVLPEYQKQGIGSELVKKMLEELYNFYMVDLCCDESLQSFYKKLGMIKSQGMICRNYKYQCSTNL
ncbi:GNAT family N-acetyltransferase [Clostridium sp. FP2]|uniref:GNAT family N-acetyltransferase n=1 Tax=Clostridium TaxID=1485 RepID=UPI0013E95670|nr:MULTISPECIES: GNAT family N-acetyltransferase [Clostridium]MBW9159387.1 GNAT family N-acetyltransferase [Clostridium tagluense]MBZ9626268.1 GNAT family N-acetyltransferase [Clostridium sp. FP2]WLC68105.1 GNAT family N-acetyltransferase [Clostridium tagluense]